MFPLYIKRRKKLEQHRNTGTTETEVLNEADIKHHIVPKKERISS